MNKITLSVDEKNLETLLTILNNLKDGLIHEIQTDAKSYKKRSTQYQPKTNRIIKEEDSGTNDSTGKYANAAAYKQRLKANK